jgi:CubicO group peptidase (beta-lactamase class C family)
MRAALVGALIVMACQSKSPSESPAGSGSSNVAAAVPTAQHRFEAWLAAFNKGDRAELQAFREKVFARDLKFPDLDGEVSFRKQTGGFDIKKVEETTTATKYAAIVKERASEQFARANVEIEAGEPHRIKRFDLLAIPTPDEMRPARMTEAEALKAVRAEIDAAAAGDRFSGTVAIAKDGVTIFAEARGLADRDAKVANKADTRFRIGSMNKMFTATATMQLVQAGKIALADPFGKHVTDYPNQALASKVTIQQLLSHMGGTGDIFGPDFDAHRLELKTHDDYVKLYGKRELEFEPGSRWAYSNYGMVLLGVVIERVAKRTYYEAVAAGVYKPAALTSTSSPVEGTTVPDRSVPYTRRDPSESWKSAVETLPYRGTAAGGGDSTVGDLLRFANALQKHALLDAAHTKQMTTKQPGTPNYAFGFSDETTGGVRCIGHGGGAPGMNGELRICDSGYTIAVLANLDPPAASQLATFIMDRLPAK